MRESVKEWLADLRSGEFKQATNVLCRKDANGNYGYCCLGVAVETYKRVTGKTPLLIPSDDVSYKETLEHFPEVQEWLGLKSYAGYTGNTLTDKNPVLASLTEVNDTGIFSFKEIADIIEEKQEQLFYE